VEFLVELGKQAGVVGTILAIACLAIWWLYRDKQKEAATHATSLEEIHKKHAEDTQAQHKKHAEDVSLLNKQYTEALALLHERHATALAGIQQKRVDDAQQMIEKLLELNNKWNATLSARGEADEELGKYLQEIRGIVMDLYMEAKR
jgi:predicted negative regulator of RcsB-dependent stress response